MPSIRQITIQRFRGISNKVSLSFVGSSGKPSSVVIVGDNGSGKSSIVDALEFALQASIHRVQKRNSLPIASAISLPNTEEGIVSVELEDGRLVSRSIRQEIDGKMEFDAHPVPEFSATPFVIRRSDILRFWDTPDSHKQTLFVNYFRNGGGIVADTASTSPKSPLSEAQEARARNKMARRNLVDELLKLGNILQEDVHGITAQMKDFVFSKGNDKDDIVPLLINVNKRSYLLDSNLITMIRRLIIVDDEIKFLSKEIERLSLFKIGEASDGSYFNRVKLGLDRISDFVSRAFTDISPSSNFIKSIVISPATISVASLEITVELEDGRLVTPLSLFSEANLDLLAILLFCGIAIDSAQDGKAKVLVLDDALQSVDASIRLELMRFLFEKLCEWQFIITVHDRLWREQIKELMRQHNHDFSEIEIMNWHYQKGVHISHKGSSNMTSLALSMGQSAPYQICSEAGLMLENICDVLSYNLPVSVTRKKGDKYTLGDLWPPIAKTLRRTDLASIVEDVSKWYHLRNMAGGHYNEAARSLSLHEAKQFGESVLHLYEGVYCTKCYKWIAELKLVTGDSMGWSCRCGSIRLSKQK